MRVCPSGCVSDCLSVTVSDFESENEASWALLSIANCQNALVTMHIVGYNGFCVSTQTGKLRVVWAPLRGKAMVSSRVSCLRNGALQGYPQS